MLRKFIGSTPQVDASASDITLYWVKEDGLSCVPCNQDELQKALLLHRESGGALIEMHDCFIVSRYHNRFPHKLNISSENVLLRIQILVQIHSQQEELKSTSSRVAGEDIGLAGLWRYSKLEEDTLPFHNELSFFLQRRLPFRVHIRNQQAAKTIFARNGPEIRCDALSSLIDVLVMSYEAKLDVMDMKRSCQHFDGLLFAFTAQI
ncbi:hypothetical protein ON010_g14038 [Phytophthora cinnamomi]|nr:hypothetical protein ON010_g14038 [Phytophthora cinnamomi]